MLICWILFIFKSIFFKAEILTPFAKYYLQTIIQVIKKYEFIIQASWFETHHFSDHWSDVHFATKFWAYNWFSFSLVSPAFALVIIVLTRWSKDPPEETGVWGSAPSFRSRSAEKVKEEKRITAHLSFTLWIKCCNISLIYKMQTAMKAKDDTLITIWPHFMYLWPTAFLFTLKLIPWFVNMITYYSHANYAERGTNFYSLLFQRI